jgi:transposase-like protein
VPRPYLSEFRRRALDLVESGRTVRDVARSLGIAESSLHRWRQQDLIDRGLKSGTGAVAGAELAAAHQRIRELGEEVKILRKAAAAVEKVVPPKRSGPGPRGPDTLIARRNYAVFTGRAGDAAGPVTSSPGSCRCSTGSWAPSTPTPCSPDPALRPGPNEADSDSGLDDRRSRSSRDCPKGRN